MQEGFPSTLKEHALSNYDLEDLGEKLNIKYFRTVLMSNNLLQLKSPKMNMLLLTCINPAILKHIAFVTGKVVT